MRPEILWKTQFSMDTTVSCPFVLNLEFILAVSDLLNEVKSSVLKTVHVCENLVQRKAMYV